MGKKTSAKNVWNATAENIKKVTAKTPYFTTQRNVSIPRVARYTALIEAGSPTPEIKMDGMLIVDGITEWWQIYCVGNQPQQHHGLLLRPLQDYRLIKLTHYRQIIRIKSEI